MLTSMLSNLPENATHQTAGCNMPVVAWTCLSKFMAKPMNLAAATTGACLQFAGQCSAV